jgi:ribulose-bisphosphate carboxylase large chain
MSSERMSVRYRIRCPAGAVAARAQALAIEQSIEMPPEAVRDARVRNEVTGTVQSIEPAGDAPGSFDVALALAAETTGNEPGQLMNVLFGNCSLQPDVELVDLQLPAELLAALPGPRFGIDGWRAAVGAQDARRPLSCTALKPQGLAPDALAALAYAFARAGIDVIKDDHGIADQATAPFAQRVPRVQAAIERANREKAAAGDALAGHRSVYAPSLSGGPRRLAAQLALLRDEGVAAALACPMILGVPGFVEQVRAGAGVPLLAHPALAGQARIAAPLLLGRLFRLFGADATIFPNWGGRFAYRRDDCLAIAACARAPLGPHAPALPVPAGGMSVERVGEMLGDYGPDTMLLIGGNLLAAGDAMPARAAEFAARVAHAFEACRH